MDAATVERLVQRTRDGGAEIVKYLKTGSAYYAPSAAATEMVEAILKDKRKILPCAAYLQGEYGITGLYVGVPCKFGAKGLEQIIEIKLTPEEKAALDKSAAAVKELVAVIGVSRLGASGVASCSQYQGERQWDGESSTERSSRANAHIVRIPIPRQSTR